jgi:hypothetical protein
VQVLSTRGSNLQDPYSDAAATKEEGGWRLKFGDGSQEFLSDEGTERMEWQVSAECALWIKKADSKPYDSDTTGIDETEVPTVLRKIMSAFAFVKTAKSQQRETPATSFMTFTMCHIGQL